MKTSLFSPLLLALLLGLIARLPAADELIHFPATVANTTLADGTALKVVATPPAAPEEITRGAPDPEPNNHWHWREGVGSGAGDKRGVFAADGHHGNDAPMLRTIVGGLKPKTDYQVFGFFWVTGFASDDAEPSGDNQWDIRLGCGKAKMMGYSHHDNAGLPGVIGRRDGGDGTIRQMDSPLRPVKGELLDRDADRRLFRAQLGTARTDAKGTLVVYVNDQAEDTNEARTWYDGIGVLPSASKADVGSGAPGALHLAVRCGDWEMVRRELEAGADLNTVDKDGLTPLFYVSANLNLDQVSVFLKAGASPDVEGQTLSPLWAAATSGDVKLTKMLLDAGAKVPGQTFPESARQDQLKASLSYAPLRTLAASSRSHPALAALFSGSVNVLKLLLEKQPTLDLDVLFLSQSQMPKPKGRPDDRPYVAMLAVDYNHPEMAEFLIDRGCRIEQARDHEIPEYKDSSANDSNKNGARSLLVQAIMAPAPMHGVVAALGRRGVTMVDNTPLMGSNFVRPWDALTAAAFAGDLVLTTRLLPMARNVSPNYQVQLIVLAEAGGNEKILAMVLKQFDEGQLPHWRWPLPGDDKEGSTEEARIFQPRSIPSKPRAAVKGKRVLAVISPPEAEGPAAAIAAQASTADGWVVVEREQIETLLKEGDLPKPWEDRVQNLGSLGDRLSADLLIIVSQLKANNLSLLRLEAVDVKTGLLIDRLHLNLTEFKPDEFCDNYLADVRKKLEDHLAGGVVTAVTLLPITVDEALPSLASVKGLLQAGLQQEIDRTSGMIALTRHQMQPLAEEKTFHQSGGLWGAAWTVEGGLIPLDETHVELALRVRSLGKDAKTHDVKVAGSTEDLQALVRKAWHQIAAAIKGGGPVPETAADPVERAAVEAARLLREAEWLWLAHRPREAAPIIDAALYLGSDPLKAAIMRTRLHMPSLRFQDPADMFNETKSLGFPVNSAVADLAARCLDEHLEMLRLSAESLNRVEKYFQDPAMADSAKETMALFNYKSYKSDFMDHLHVFLSYRSYLQPRRMGVAQLATLKTFDKELAQHLRRLFAHINPNGEKAISINENKRFTTQHYRAVPALGTVMAELVLRDWYEYSDVYFYNDIFEKPSYAAARGPTRMGIMCDILEKAMAGKDIPNRDLREAEIAFLRSSGGQRALAARQLLRIRISMSSRPCKPYQDWVPLKHLSWWVPMIDGEYHDGFFIPPHDETFIPALVHSPEQAPDMLVRFNNYELFRKPWLRIPIGDIDSEKSLLDRHVERTLKAASQGSGNAFDCLLSGTRLLDRIYGVALTADLEPKVAKLRPKGKLGNFGSKGQFPILDYEGTVDTKLLADVRSGAMDNPAMITHSLIDPTNRHILWLAVEPYQDWDFKLQQFCPIGGSIPPYTARQPWLIAIDCRNGRAIHKINLATIPGLWPKDPPETMQIQEFGQTFYVGMFANDTHLLLQIYWRRQPYDRAQKTPDVYVLMSINRETGEIQKHVLNENIVDRQRGMLSNSKHPAVVGIGKSFFVLENWEAPTLWRLTPGSPMKLLAKPGRRPEESPFDREDRKIDLLRNDGGRLLVASSWDNFAYYDPAKERWEDAPKRTPDEWSKGHVLNLDRNDYWAAYSHYQFNLDDGGTNNYQFDYRERSDTGSAAPGRLKFKIGDGPLSYLPVRMTMPKTYRARFQVDSDRGSPSRNPADRKYEWIDVADMTRSIMVTPAILNQTDDNLVFAARLSPSESHVSYSAPPYLPFLWILNKKEAAEAMQRAQGK